MMERLARDEKAAYAAEDEKAVALEHERRRAAAMALLNQHNPDWFAGEVGQQTSPPSRRGSWEGRAERDKAQSDVGPITDDEKRKAAAAVAKQRALAMALLQEHNEDWFGEVDSKPSASRKPSIFRRIGSRKANKYTSIANSPRVDEESQPTPTKTLTRSYGRIRSESPPSLLQRGKGQRRRFGRKTVTERDSPERNSGSWFSRSPSQTGHSCPVTPAGRSHGRGRISSRGQDVDMSITQVPIVQPPLMDVLENKSEEPMSLRSMLRFSRGNLMEENVLFYLEVSSFKTSGGGQSEYLTHAKRIKELYIQPGSAREVNISGDIRDKTVEAANAIFSKHGEDSNNKDDASCCGSGTGNGLGVCLSPPSELSPLRRKENHDHDHDHAGEDRHQQQQQQQQQANPAESDEAPPAPAPAPAPAGEAGRTPRTEVDGDGVGDGDGDGDGDGLGKKLGPELAERAGVTAAGSRAHEAAEARFGRDGVGRPRAPSPSRRPPPLPPRPPRTPVSVSQAATTNGNSKANVNGGSGTTRGEITEQEGGGGGDHNVNDDDDGLEEMRDRRDSTGIFDRLGTSVDYVDNEDLEDFNASVEIEALGLGIGPGGGYGDRTIFDSALLEIFVILRHEVYPKFIAHVVQRSRETTPRVASATATPRTATAKRSPSPAAAAAETTRSPPAAPTPAKRDGPLSPNALERQLERASWSQSADVAKAVRAEHAKCYY